MSKTIRELMSEIQPDWNGQIQIFQGDYIIFWGKDRKSIPEELLDRELCRYLFTKTAYHDRLVNVARLEVKSDDKPDVLVCKSQNVTLGEAYRQDRRIKNFRGRVLVSENGETLFFGDSLESVPDMYWSRKLYKAEIFNMKPEKLMLICLCSSENAEKEEKISSAAGCIKRIDYTERAINSVGPVAGKNTERKMSVLYNPRNVCEETVLKLISDGLVAYCDDVVCVSRRQADKLFGDKL